VLSFAIEGIELIAVGGGSEPRFAVQCSVIAMALQVHLRRVTLGPPGFVRRDWTYQPAYTTFDFMNILGVRRLMQTGEPWSPFADRGATTSTYLRTNWPMQ
jgi:hypothetical protein